MASLTKIEWADKTWNPWFGCTKVSPGCMNCYAAVSTPSRIQGVKWGKGQPRKRTSEAYWKDPAKWDREAAEDLNDFYSHEGLHGGHAHYPKPRPPRVFPSLCDWLDDEVPIEWLADFLRVIYSTPNLDWLLLTKRPQNFASRLKAAIGVMHCDPMDYGDRIDAWIKGERIPRNVWLGVSVEDQIRADQRIPILLETPARVRFLSCEPLLGLVDLMLRNKLHGFPKRVQADESAVYYSVSMLLHWVIVGGESGPGARPCNVAWIRSLVDQCKAANVACFVKQLGGKPFDPRKADNIPSRKLSHESELTDLDAELFDQMVSAMVMKLSHPKGGDPAEWPEDLAVRESPSEPRSPSAPPRSPRETTVPSGPQKPN